MERARNLRRSQADAEARLWSRLRGSQLGVKFRRQHPLDGYIADFACVEKRLIVELDGGQHADAQRYDERRTRALEALGFRVLRLWNDEALVRTDDVMTAIVRALNQPPPPHPDPLPPLRRGRGSKSASRARDAGKTPAPPTARSGLDRTHRLDSPHSADRVGKHPLLDSLSPDGAAGGGEGRGEGVWPRCASEVMHDDDA